MPNHIQNRLRVIGSKSEIKKVLDSLKAKDDDNNEIEIDFNKIIPMPKGLDVHAHSGIKMWVEICTGQLDFNCLFKPLDKSPSELFKERNYSALSTRMAASTAMDHLTAKREGNVKDLSDDEFEIFVQCLRNVRNHGDTSWFEWSKKNWGTKWNAYGLNDERNTEDTIYFQTAWNGVPNLILLLSKKFPDVKFDYKYADEDTGSNCGLGIFENGNHDFREPDNLSNECYEIAFELNPDAEKYYHLVNGKYQYIDEEE
ncbi:hypothetical protein [Winogradskyella luteola]|uniref:YubB ferredoxin-like domain-containing protein n=1 Tax=Winogradskyella luteola TaxID=2828330 RepID=A0A9X1F860_9FLAO|nr:hypothetical protein [Winogradskyella luteola]MBV7268393.1 hypothetical protein [Winogradskyella luteola]